MLSYKKPVFWIIIATLIACVVGVVCLLTSPEDGEAAAEPFGRNYSVEDIVYDAPQYSFSYTPQTAPDYRLTADRQLMIREDTNADAWLNAGRFAEELLSPLTFDDYFKDYDGISGWRDDGINAEKLRLDTQKAWRLDVSAGAPDSVFYLLLQLKNGDVYLTYGYEDGESHTAAAAGSRIRWVFKFGATPATKTIAADDPAQVAAGDGS